MQTVLNATDVRANFGGFIDTIIREKPQAIKRNRDVIMAFSKQQMKELLSVYELTFEYEQDDDNLRGRIKLRAQTAPQSSARSNPHVLLRIGAIPSLLHGSPYETRLFHVGFLGRYFYGGGFRGVWSCQ